MLTYKLEDVTTEQQHRRKKMMVPPELMDEIVDSLKGFAHEATTSCPIRVVEGFVAEAVINDEGDFGVSLKLVTDHGPLRLRLSESQSRVLGVQLTAEADRP